MEYDETAGQRLPGAALDRHAIERVLAALSPAQIRESLPAVDELERQQAEVLAQWQRRLEAARYQATLAQRRYEQVDPQDRVVARTLEQGSEAALREVEHLEMEPAAFRRIRPLAFSAEQRQTLLPLAKDLDRVCSGPTTTWAQRKDLLRL